MLPSISKITTGWYNWNAKNRKDQFKNTAEKILDIPLENSKRFKDRNYKIAFARTFNDFPGH